jgi:hypothetical protein
MDSRLKKNNLIAARAALTRAHAACLNERGHGDSDSKLHALAVALKVLSEEADIDAVVEAIENLTNKDVSEAIAELEADECEDFEIGTFVVSENPSDNRFEDGEVALVYFEDCVVHKHDGKYLKGARLGELESGEVRLATNDEVKKFFNDLLAHVDDVDWEVINKIVIAAESV